MKHRTDSNSKKAVTDFPWGWIILGAAFLAAVVVLVAYHNAVRWQNVILYQLFSGFLLAIFGGAISGWGIAAFIASSKGTTPRASAYETRPKEPPSPTDSTPPNPGQPDPGDPNISKRAYATPDVVEELGPDAPLEAVSGIGPKRAEAAATLNFEKLSDVIAASPEAKQKLKAVWGGALLAAVLLLAHAANERAARSRL